MNLLKLNPWDRDEKPFWTNPENGFNWYVDKNLTEWCNKWMPNNSPALNAICFIIAEPKDDSFIKKGYSVICKKTNQELAHANGMEDMAVKIEGLRINKYFENQENK